MAQHDAHAERHQDGAETDESQRPMSQQLDGVGCQSAWQMANGEFGERERRERRFGRGQVEQPLEEDRRPCRGQTNDGVGYPRPVCGRARTFVASGRLVALVVRGGLKALVAH